MSHKIESIDLTFSISSKEWHGLAVQVDQSEIVEQVEKHLCFPIVESPAIAIVEGEQVELMDEEGEGFKILIADMRNTPKHDGRKAHPARLVPIHTCKSSYAHFENGLLFKGVINAVKEVGYEAQVATAGTLGALQYFYASLTIPGHEKFNDPRGFEVLNYLNLLSSHNGVYSLHTKRCHTKTVCMNTYQGAMNEASDFDCIVKHTKNAQPVFMIEKALKAYLEGIIDTQALFANLERQSLTLSEMRAISAGYFLQPAMALAREQKKEVRADKLKLSTQAKNAITGIVELAMDGKGNSGRTQYDLLNGATDWWSNGGGVGGDQVGLSKKVYRSRFGSADTHKTEFIKYLSNSELVAEGLALGGEVLANV